MAIRSHERHTGRRVNCCIKQLRLGTRSFNMELEQMISAVEKLQAIYDSFNDEQTEAKQKTRWAINHLADKIWIESM